MTNSVMLTRLELFFELAMVALVSCNMLFPTAAMIFTPFIGAVGFFYIIIKLVMIVIWTVAIIALWAVVFNDWSEFPNLNEIKNEVNKKKNVWKKVGSWIQTVIKYGFALFVAILFAYSKHSGLSALVVFSMIEYTIMLFLLSALSHKIKQGEV